MKIRDKDAVIWDWRLGLFIFLVFSVVLITICAISNIYHFLHPLPLCSSLSYAQRHAPGYVGCMLTLPPQRATWWDAIRPVISLGFVLFFGYILLYSLGLSIDALRNARRDR